MKITFVVGPTASGKSELALTLAQKNKGVIVNCDSVQMYSEVHIGAAKPSLEELKLIPHYLYGHVVPPQKYTAGEFRRDFFSLLEDLKNQNQEIVYVVGGTGFYFQALEFGMYSVDECSLEIKTELLKIASTPEGVLSLYEELKHHDPEFAQKIHPHDQYRLIRSVEILRSSGKRPSELKSEMKLLAKSFPYQLNKIGVHMARELLHEHIHRRVQKMLKMGLIEEVQGLIQKGLSDWEPLRSVGYKEVQLYLKGEIKSLHELEDKITISTRQLAKKQITWFKRDKAIEWIDGSDSN